MRATAREAPHRDILGRRSVFWFVAIVIAWLVIAQGPDWTAPAWRGLARLAGYGALLAMLVPYAHVARRALRARRGVAMRVWLRWHVVAAYIAFFLVLAHSRGRSNGPLTSALLWLTWIVMISGVIGYYGQKLLYLLMPRVVPHEFGLERLEPQRDLLLESAETLLKKKEMQACPEVIQAFCRTAIAECLAPPLRGWDWLRRRRTGNDQLSANWYERTLTYADAKQQAILQEIWGLVRQRRSLDLEYRLHQLGRLWLLVHGPAAWALLVLMMEHAMLSMWHGGF